MKISRPGKYDQTVTHAKEGIGIKYQEYETGLSKRIVGQTNISRT